VFLYHVCPEMLHLFFYCMNNKLEVCKKQMCQNAKNFGQKGKDTFFIPGWAAEAFQSLFSHTDGKIRDGCGADGCGRKVVGSDGSIQTQHSPYL
jgi:hypothetical protein